MRRCAPAWLTAGLLLAGGGWSVVPAADGPASRKLIYFSEGGPLVVSVDISLSGQSVPEFRRAFIERQFQQHDKDRNGRLIETEARQIPAFGRGENGSATLGDAWKTLDRKPMDEALSVDEVEAHYESAMGPAFSLEKKVRERFQEVDLVGRLDRDGDHALSANEITGGLDALIRLDLDDDETISAAELAPLFDPSVNARMPNRPQVVLEAWPFLLVTDEGEGSPAGAARSLLRQYDKGGDGASGDRKADGRLSRDEIPAVFSRMSGADRDGDGQLNEAELTQFIAAPLKPLVIGVQMPQRGAARVDHPELPDRSIEFKAFKWSSDVQDTVALNRIRFLRSDADKNKYIDATEFGGLEVRDAPFEVVDLNGDGMLMIEELVSFTDQRATLSRCRVIMRVESEQRSLFEILDADADRRLTRSEFLGGLERLREYDADRDTLFELSDLTTRYRVVIEMARTELFAGATLMQPSAEANSPRLQSSETGPVWFTRMDANRDGVVSQREFLGPLEDFAAFDGNRDGLLQVDEVR